MDLITLKEFLDFKIFQIPNYQRGFSWGKVQIDELLDDLEDLTYVNEHYAGTFTLQQQGDETVNVGLVPRPLYDVVDGQQRLITIQLILSCIDHRCHQLKSSIPDIEDFYLEHDVPKLRLHSDQTLFFKQVLKARKLSDVKALKAHNFTEKNLKAAKEMLIKRFSNKMEEQCKNTFSHLLNKMKVNVFIVTTQNEVGLIFETMNDRGLPLSDIDKIKNYLMYLCQRFKSNDLALEVNESFGTVFRRLLLVKHRDYFVIEDHFLRNAYITYTGDTSNLSNIHKKVKLNLIKKYASNTNHDLFFNNHVQRNEKRHEIKDFTTYLETSSLYYSNIYTFNHSNSEINEVLERLFYLEHLDAFVPLILAMMFNPTFQDHLIVKILKLIEVYVVRLFCIEQKDAKIGLAKIKTMAYQVFIKKMTFKVLNKGIKTIIKDNCDGNSLKRSLKNIDYYSETSHHRFIKYFLFEYESYLRELNSETDFSTLDFVNDTRYTIEHIAPQKSQQGTSKVSKLHGLGNLVMTKDNSQLGNAGFVDKKGIYKDSDLLSERELTNFAVWDKASMNKRSSDLYEFAKKRWK